MKGYRMVVLVMVVLAGTGCASVRTVHLEGADGPDLVQVNRAVQGKVARITLDQGEPRSVVGVHLTPDSLYWVDLRANALRSVPMHAVREVRVVKAGQGAMKGLVAGALLGAGVGVLRAFLQGDDPVDDPIGISQSEKLRLFPPVHALYASLFTVPLGAIIGSHRVYRFAEAPPDAAEGSR